ncbi:MAG: hypothetical protein QM500_15615 [Methylococcales bacterium]
MSLVKNQKKRSKSQKKADAKYEEKRAKRPQLRGYLDEDEAKLLSEADKEFGGKKAGVIGALKFWKKYKNRFNKNESL